METILISVREWVIGTPAGITVLATSVILAIYTAISLD